MSRSRYRGFLFIAALGSGLLGCNTRSEWMRPVAPDKVIDRPSNGKALVVFMRLDDGDPVQSSVFEISGRDKLVGIVSEGTRVVYETDPGRHRFMVIGENADFMDAHLVAGKTYYAFVVPRWGWVKPRFSFEPVRRRDLTYKAYTHLDTVENTPGALAWAKENWPSIQDKKVDYLRKWTSKPQSERDEQTLFEDDGR